MNKEYIKLNIDGWYTQDKEYAKRFNDSLVNNEDIYHEIAKNYVITMSRKMGNKSKSLLSLDEFLCEYSDYIDYDDLKLGESILRLFEL